jgi:Xaa-Pro aminopeptidase
MPTADGCRERRRRFLDVLQPREPILLADPIHLRYLANFHIEPFSLGADYGGILGIAPDGGTILYHDNRLPKSVEAAYVDERTAAEWYDGQSPGRGARGMILRRALTGVEIRPGRVHDFIGDLHAGAIHDIITELRRRKDPDEIATLRECMRVTEAGHAWARANVRPGMTELDVYAGVCKACNEAVGRWVLVYGDLVVSDGPGRRTGPPTPRVIQPGEMFILDFSVVIQGYRSDFTNTLVVGRTPTADQHRLFDLCVIALSAGENELRPGRTCQAVYDAIHLVFEAAAVADHFPHHAGHGLGLGHPEAPFFVRHSTETLAVGDVVTLEPGLYVDGVGGVRVEHNYLITESGSERLSNHVLSLT